MAPFDGRRGGQGLLLQIFDWADRFDAGDVFGIDTVIQTIQRHLASNQNKGTRGPTAKAYEERIRLI